jgi:SAM-dependent methyltransferase
MVLVCGIARTQTNSGPKEGDRAPGFSITTDRGTRISPTAFGGSLLVLNFWETSCVPCVREIPSLSDFARRFRSAHVVVVAVSGDEDAQKYRRFLRDHRIALNTYRDPDRRISGSFGTSMFPETYLIQDGRIIRKVLGPIDWMSSDIAAFVRTRLQAPPKVPDSHEGERKAYDEIYSTSSDTFSAAPNAFMMRTIAGRKPGRALDVAMGQGRNALWLAAHGWTVTGFDISPVGVEIARKEAEKRGLLIEGLVTSYEDFDWGKEKWDLIVFSYFFPQAALPKVWDALKPGGLIVVEGFHIDTARVRPVGGGYRNNELFQVLKDYRVLIYEDVQDRQEWGLPYGATNRLVRVLAQKSVPLPAGCWWERKSYEQGAFMCWGVTRWTCGVEGWQSAGKCTTASRR